MKAGPRLLPSPGTQHLLGSVILMASQDGFHQAVSKTALYPYVPFQFFFPFTPVINGSRKQIHYPQLLRESSSDAAGDSS